jgi:glyoxylase-like metal-dependent hydrolase (beta-lactamase superfamily II)
MVVTNLAEAELDQAVEISPDIFWVGSGTTSFLNRNSYLRVYRGEGNTRANMLIDPGPTSDMDDLMHKVSPVLGDISRINLVFINHQDPDVVGNLPTIIKMNPKAVVMASEDTWRLVGLNNSHSTKFKPVERFKDFKVGLNTSPGHRMQFVPTPFCHFRGACMLYDLDSRILFSGDFMGGVAATSLEASEANWAGIKAFHQLYMPSNDAIRLAVQKIRNLQPAPLMIAPQHGGIIKGELIETLLTRMEELQVGLDIMVSLETRLPVLISALNEIIAVFRERCGDEVTEKVLGFFRVDGSYTSLFSLTQGGIVTDIKGDPVEVVEMLIKLFFLHITVAQRGMIRARIILILLEHNLPPFDLLLNHEEQVEVEFNGDMMVA